MRAQLFYALRIDTSNALCIMIPTNTGDADMTSQTKPHFQYEPGDQVLDLTMDPPIPGIVTAKTAKPDAYQVRLQDRATDVVIHARNLKKN